MTVVDSRTVICNEWSREKMVIGYILIMIASFFVSSWLQDLYQIKVERERAEARKQQIVAEQVWQAKWNEHIEMQQQMDAIVGASIAADQARRAEEEAKRAAEIAAKEANKPVVTGSGVALSQNDKAWIAQVVMAEAGSQSQSEQIMVAEVILKRVASEKFPNTVAGVLCQSGQFETVASDGNVYRGSGANRTLVIDEGVTDSCKEAVNIAASGSSLSGDALYFYGNGTNNVFY